MKLGVFMMPVNDYRRGTHTVLKEDVEIAVIADELGLDGELARMFDRKEERNMTILVRPWAERKWQ